MEKMNTSHPLSIYCLPGNWKTPGDPTPGELAKTLRTVHKILDKNLVALETRNVDEDLCYENVRICTCMLYSLYDYLEGGY
jgi:hypothetical protein